MRILLYHPILTRERMRESERDIQNAQPPPSEPNSPTFGAFTTPARNGDSIDLIRAARAAGVSFGGGDFITDAFGPGGVAHKKPTTVMALNRWRRERRRKEE